MEDSYYVNTLRKIFSWHVGKKQEENSAETVTEMSARYISKTA